MPENEHPEGLPPREPETYPKYVPLDPSDLPAGLFEQIMGKVGQEVNHQQLRRFESAIAHAENDEAETEAIKALHTWIDSLTSSELRDVLSYAAAGLSQAHSLLHELTGRKRHRVWEFVKDTVTDPGSWILSAVVVGFAVVVWVLR